MGLVSGALKVLSRGLPLVGLFKTAKSSGLVPGHLEENDLFSKCMDIVVKAADWGERFEAGTIDKKKAAGKGIALVLRQAAKAKGYKEQDGSNIDEVATEIAGLMYDVAQCFETDEKNLTQETA